FGMGIDPSVRKRDRNPTLFGTGKWNRVLIDATMNLDYDPDPDLGGARFPPTVWPDNDDIAKAYARWSEFGFGKPKGRGRCQRRSGRVAAKPPTETTPMTEQAVTIPSARLKLSGVVHVPRA